MLSFGEDAKATADHKKKHFHIHAYTHFLLLLVVIQQCKERKKDVNEQEKKASSEREFFKRDLKTFGCSHKNHFSFVLLRTNKISKKEENSLCCLLPFVDNVTTKSWIVFECELGKGFSFRNEISCNNYSFVEGSASRRPTKPTTPSTRHKFQTYTHSLLRSWWAHKNGMAHISEWKLKTKKNGNLYVLLMLHINVILKCESRFACAVSAVVFIVQSWWK